MDEAEFDKQHAQWYADCLDQGNYDGMIMLCKDLLLNANPTPSLRIELLTGVAMAQVGKVNSFVNGVKEEGKELRALFAMTNEESRQIATNVAICLGLQADGIGKVETPMELMGDKDA